MGLENKAVKRELKKHAATIHCSNTLSLLQRKISNALLYHAYHELQSKAEHEITVKELCKLIAYSGNNHAAIKESLKGLLSTVIEWNVVNDTTGVEDWTASSILASVSLRGPICLYAYSPRMKELLHSPSMFGKINLFIQSRFKSSYGLALYENCIRYRGLAYTKWFDVVTFRKLMGVPDDKYTVFRDFKRRVLDKSVEEVNTYSDLIVEAEVHRDGRQVTRIRFSLKERAKRTRLGAKLLTDGSEETTSVSPEMTYLAEKLQQQYGFTAEQVREIMTEYGQDYILEKISLIELSKNYQIGKVQNLAAYLLSALRNNYQPAKTSLAKPTRDQGSIKHTVEIKKLQTTVKRIRKNYADYREKEIAKALDNITFGDFNRLTEEFRQHAADSIKTILKLQRKKYTLETIMNSPQIQALFRQFVQQKLPGLREQMLSLESFINNLPEKTRSAWQALENIEPEHDLLKLTE